MTQQTTRNWIAGHKSTVLKGAMLIAFVVLVMLHPGRLTQAQSTPTGPAGGDLSGTYPNPTLSTDRVRKGGDSMTGALDITIPGPQFNNPVLKLRLDYSTAGSGAKQYFNLTNSNNAAVTYAGVGGFIVSSTAGAENGALRFFVANGGALTEKAVLYNNGFFGIGTTTPSAPLHVVKDWNGALSTYILGTFDSYDDQGRVVIRRANGDLGAETQVLYGQGLGSLQFRGWHSGGAFGASQAASISGVAAENFTSTGMGAGLQFSTTPVGTTTAATRMVIDAAGNVGVGTTDPSQGGVITNARFTIVSPDNTHTAFATSNGTVPRFALANLSSGGWSMWDYAGNAWHSGIIQVSGRIGLGTATPSYLFDAQGGQINASGGLCMAGDCKTTWAQVGGGSSQWTTAGANVYYSTGNVGMGTANPAYARLQVNKSVRIDDDSGSATGSDTLGSAPNLYLGTTNGGGAFQFNGAGGVDLWQFNNNVWGRNFSFTKTGLLGIGTSTPDTKLQVKSSTTLAGEGLFKLQNSAGSSLITMGDDSLEAYRGQLSIYGKQSGANYERLRIWHTGDNNDAIVFASEAGGTGTQRNIRFAAPTTMFSGIFNARAAQITSATGSPNFISFWETNVAFNGAIGFDAGSQNMVFQTGGSGLLNGTTRMTIAPTGNVGIGTGSPTAKLDVNGTINATGLTVNGAAVGGSQWTNGSGNINYASGNVGIGVANPADKLHLNGVVTNGGGITIDNSGLSKFRIGTAASTIPNWSGQLMNAKYDQAAGNWNLDDPSLNAGFLKFDLRPQSNGNEIAFYRMLAGSNPRPDTWTSLLQMRLDTGNIYLAPTSGNVGVGTTTPAYKFDVAGQIRSSTGGFIFPDGSTQITAATSGGSGSITGVSAGAGLLGGGTTGVATLDIGAGTGVSVAADSISVNYGSTAGTAVQGNTSLTVTAGSGMSGGGQLTLGSGGTLTLTNADKGSTQNIFKNVADSAGTAQFSAGTNNDAIRFAGTGNTSVTFDAATRKVIIDSTGSGNGTITSVTAGAGLTGGGTSGGATLDIGAGTGVSVAADAISVNYGSTAGTAVQGNTSLTVTAGSGMSGGGPLTLGSGGTLTLTNADKGSTQNIFKNVANAAGTTQFAAGTNNDAVRFAGSGGTSVTFDAATKKVIIDSSGSTPTAANIAAGQFGLNTGGGDYTFPHDVTVMGNIAAKYQDVAEWVNSSQALAAGTVVVLDQTRSNQVVASFEAYDTRVAGVISVQPGIALGVAGAGKVLVATTGRVRIKVDASSGPIRIGDLLVTSDKAGMAMKSQPISIGSTQIHRPGTLIGKALESLESGTGEMLVLLSLQ